MTFVSCEFLVYIKQGLGVYNYTLRPFAIYENMRCISSAADAKLNKEMLRFLNALIIVPSLYLYLTEFEMHACHLIQ